ncbi:hypothetical protein GCM10007920_27080 [Ciceribacter naphthalenivorans]|uniref:Uncharacterized protein n=1 Tax=Sphingomonas psychrolutea TaxID=1259676 RepID=A0ABQ6ED69_9SPHN|nr:hypothetical protein GCM10007920_27080 [Ciceribacter naphthalenivorans]GLT05776.1 hypothetical protein GCM10007926_27080 [Sphingomonas psychrolutea]
MRVLCAFAILSLAFAHKPPQVMAAAYESASLRLPDGTFADLCISDAAIKHPLVHQFCEACALASSTVLPLPDDGAWLLGLFASLENRLGEARSGGERRFILRQRARAPPAFA